MKSIFSRLILSFLVMIIFVLFSIGVLFSGLLKNYLISQKEAELKNKGSQIVEISRMFLNKSISESTFSLIIRSIDEVVDSRTLIIDKSGIILSSSFVPPRSRDRNFGLLYPLKGMRFDDADIAQVFKGLTVVKTGYNIFFNEPMITVGIPVYVDNAKTIIAGAIILNSPVQGVTEAMNKTNTMLIFASLGALVISLFGAYLLSKTLSKPIHMISKAALEIAEGNYAKKVNIDREDEIGNLALTFNYLTDKLDDTISDLNNEKSKLSDILSSMEEGLIAVDKDLNIIHINPAAAFLLNIEERPSVLQDITGSESIVTNIQELLEKGKSKSYEKKISENRFVNILISPLKYKNGEIYGAIILLQDISQSVKLERMRRDFVANVSHELRTPLTSIRGFIEPLIDGTVEDEDTRMKYNKIIRNETLRLERLINDLLDLSRLQAGKLVLDIQRVDIIELISNVSGKFQHVFDSKEIEFIFNNPEHPVFISADGDRVEQLIIIFIDNAIKFTPQGGRIEISLVEEDGHVRIKVSDNGMGIPEEDIPYIWERFYKVDKSRTDKNSGTGLGLSIAKNIIELHGQKVSVESKLGEGTVFEFTMRREAL